MDIPTKAIKILTYKNDLVLDPFMGTGTTGLGAKELNRNWIGFEMQQDYISIAEKRIGCYVENI